MSLRHRVADVERRVERLREAGQEFEVRLVRVGMTTEAATMERAHELIEQHKKDRPLVPIWVTKAGTRGQERLTEWEPPLPEWLQEAMRESAAHRAARSN